MNCDLCGRAGLELTKHHLIPVTRHKNKKNKKDFSRQEVKTRIAMVCHACQKMIHALFSEKELERDYNTVQALKEHPDIAKYVEWIKDKPNLIDIDVREKRRDNLWRNR